MRLTGGSLRGRTLQAPQNETTRPTTDRVREALFDILCHHDWGDAIGDPISDKHVLDAFAGSGALGFDAVSRGAAGVAFFERDRAAQGAIKANIQKLDLGSKAHLWGGDALKPPQATEPCDLIFLDPPYRKELIPAAIIALEKAGWIAPTALIVAEAAKKETPPLCPGWALLLSRSYGDTSVYFLARSSQES